MHNDPSGFVEFAGRNLTEISMIARL